MCFWGDCVVLVCGWNCTVFSLLKCFTALLRVAGSAYGTACGANAVLVSFPALLYRHRCVVSGRSSLQKENDFFASQLECGWQ